MTHRHWLRLTIVLALSGCGTADPMGSPGADGAVSATPDAEVATGDVAVTEDAATPPADAAALSDARLPVDATDRDIGTELGMDAPDLRSEDVAAVTDAPVAVDGAADAGATEAGVDAAAQPDVPPAVDVPTRDVLCGPLRQCVAACDEGRTGCVACATACSQRCDMTGTACNLTCGTNLGTCLSRCPSLSACYANCNTLPVNQRVACLGACGLCTDNCTTTSANCRTACDETERQCIARCEGSCASAADGGAPLTCASAQTACAQRCPAEDC